jgi:hypothetical protein
MRISADTGDSLRRRSEDERALIRKLLAAEGARRAHNPAWGSTQSKATITFSIDESAPFPCLHRT